MRVRKSLLLTLTLFIAAGQPAYAAKKAKNKTCEANLMAGAQAANRFDLNVLREILNESPVTENTLLTAPALYSAMSTVANGASGPAQAEVLAALGYSELDQLNAYSLQATKYLNSKRNDVTVSLASHLFSDKSFQVLDSFKQGLLQSGGSSSSHAFHDDPEQTAKEINAWASKSTNKLINNIITKDTVGSLESLLASAFYFKGTWKYQFDPKMTRPDRFETGSGETKMVPLMTQIIPEIRAYQAKDYLVARIPYEGDSVAMYIVFPRKDWSSQKPVISASEALEKSLSSSDLEKFEGGQDQDIQTFTEEDLTLPRFKIKYSNKNLRSQLEKLGVRGIFKGGSLLNMSTDPRLYVAYVRLDSLLEVNEEGSEAAGVASVGFALESMSIKRFEFNRAFGVVIRDEKAGINMVTGVIQDPST